jgi:hypothetical protein
VIVPASASGAPQRPPAAATGPTQAARTTPAAPTPRPALPAAQQAQPVRAAQVPTPPPSETGRRPAAPPAKAVAVPAAPSEAATPAGAPYVTSGVVTFDDPEPTATPSAYDLKKRIAKACGHAAKDVEVVIKSNTCLGVQLRVHDAAAADRISETILGMPELACYEIDLNVQVMPAHK